MIFANHFETAPSLFYEHRPILQRVFSAFGYHPVINNQRTGSRVLRGLPWRSGTPWNRPA